MKKTAIIGIAFVFLAAINVNAQLNTGGEPYSYSHFLKTQDYEIKVMPAFDAESMRQEDRENRLMGDKRLRFAKVFEVNYNLENSGTWIQLHDGSRLWQLGIYSKDAYSINIIFNDFYLCQGARLYIHNLERSHHIGGYNHLNNNAYEVLATEAVAGDFVVIEYYEPAGIQEKSRLQIGSIGHDYTGIFKTMAGSDGFFGTSGDCNVDINCPEGEDWHKLKQSVALMLTSGQYLCTGALINNTALDATPYFFTANHCIEENEEALNTVFYFNYEHENCNDETNPFASVNDIQSISGAALIATAPDNKLDFSLLMLSDDVPEGFDPYFAGWNRSTDAANSAVCIHHPSGDFKKISVDDDPVVGANYGDGYDANSHWLVQDWEAGTTEGGSSGSPLFDENRRIIGDLTGGEANCENPVNDYYAKFSRSWNDYPEEDQQLKPWLDPENTGVLVLDGYDPFSVGTISGCDTLNQFIGNGALYTLNDENNNYAGYLAGNNSFGDLAKAEYYASMQGKDVITGGVYLFGYAHGTASTVTFALWQDEDGTPGDMLASTTLPIGDIADDVNDNLFTEITFDNPVPVDGAFYIGVMLPTNGDTLALVTNTINDSEVNTGWELWNNNSWHEYSEFVAPLSNAIFAVACNYSQVFENEYVNSDEALVFPNPFKESVTLIMKNPDQIQSLAVYDFYGRLIKSLDTKHSIQGKQVFINLQDCRQGLYFLNITTSHNRIVKPLVKIH